MKTESFLLTSLVVLFAGSASAATNSWVYYNTTNQLTYQTWGNGNRIMDFSHAGYMGGGVALPQVATVLTLNPSGGDDRTALQNAINTVAARPLVNGFRGALQLGAGTFLVSGQLNINAGGVVLRGAGSGAGGTTLRMTSASTMTLFSIVGSGSPSESGTVNITNAYVPSGTTSFNVSSAAGFSVGDNVNVYRPVTSNWVHYVGMDTLVRDGVTQTWLTVGSKIKTDRTIKQISGNQITLDVPLTDSFDSQYLGNPVGTMARYTWSGRISQVGLEHLRIEAPAVATAYVSVHMNNLIDSWARDVVIQDGVNCFTLDKDTKRVTVDEVIISHTVPSTNAAGPSDFACTGTQILFNKCQALGTGSWPFVTHTTGTGPIVVLNFYSTQQAGISPHQRWCTGVLADNCSLPNAPNGTQGIAYRNRNTMGSGQGWTTGWSVAWNVITPYFLVSAAPGTEDWCIGGIGTKTSRAGNGDPDGIYDSLGAHVSLGATDSLYLEQLRERLGDAALANIGYGAPDFSVAATPGSQSVLTGNGTNFIVTVGALDGFHSNVVLSVNGVPANTGVNFNPPIVTGAGDSILTLTTSNSTPAGGYPLDIVGASSGVTHTAAVNLVVLNFSLSAEPAVQGVVAGSNVTYTVTVATNRGFSGDVALGLAGLPANTGGSFAPPILSGAGTSTLTVTTTSNAPAGSYTLTIRGTNASGTAGGTASLVVTSLTANPGTLLWNGAGGVDEDWSTILNWTNLSSGGYGPPGPDNAVLFTNDAAVASSALTSPGSGVVIPGNLNSSLNASFTVNALTNYANAPSSSPVYHNIGIAGGTVLTVAGTTQVGGYNTYDFGGNNVVAMTVSGAGGAWQQNGTLNVIESSTSTGTHNAVLDMSGLDTFALTNGQLRIGIEGGSGARSHSTGLLYLARTNTIGVTSGNNVGCYVGHNKNAAPTVPPALYLGISNAIFMANGTGIMIGRANTPGAIMAFNPAFLGSHPVVCIRGADSASRVAAWNIGDNTANNNNSANPTSGTNDFTGGTLDALVNVMQVGLSCPAGASATGSGTGTLTFDDGILDVNTLQLGVDSGNTGSSAGIGQMNVNGGTLKVNTLLQLGVFVAGSGGTPQGTLNIAGGTVQAGNIAGGGGLAVINLKSGTLHAPTGSLTGITTLNIGAPGASDPATLTGAASVTAANAITIFPNGMVAGNTIITSPGLMVDGTLSPGAPDGSVGGLTHNGPVTFGGGGRLAFDVLDADGVAGAGWDFLSVTGAINLQATGETPFTINLQSLGDGGPAAVTNFNCDTNYDWSAAAASGGIANFDASKFSVESSQFQNDLGGGYFFVHTNNNALSLAFTNNHPPAAAMAEYYRSGDTTRIPVADLATRWSDPDGDPVTLAGVDTSSTNGINNVATDGTFIYYTNSGSLTDAFSYVVADVRTNPPAVYRPDDSVRTAVGTVVLLPPRPAAAIELLGTNVVISGLNWPTGATFFVLTSTNVSLPVANWTVLETNAFDGAGGFTFTNGITPGRRSQFYRLEVP